MSDPGLTGIIGGSGLYGMEGLTQARWEKVSSPFGEPSDELLFGELGGRPVVFLPRHGRGHRLPPGAINYRANIDALKRVGVSSLISVSAVGSLRISLPPGVFVLVDQYIDRTQSRPRSFFETGCVAHVSLAHPTCDRLNKLVYDAAASAGLTMVMGGTYLAMEGPQFSCRAESLMYQQWGCDVIGMTSMPEARLAREAEICYANVAMVTDYDCWHPRHEQVSVAQIVETLQANAAKAQHLVGLAAPACAADPQASACSCRFALDHAVITPPESRDPALMGRLDAVAARIIGP
ncbi:MAG: S-methyl-5'-thioadenosine phosphorylase [Candidatus Adiutrix sp.]|nr:S-methyl-5'-thioadenosine phosphorylase [Candidatus Adiutrix sp.]